MTKDKTLTTESQASSCAKAIDRLGAVLDSEFPELTAAEAAFVCGHLWFHTQRMASETLKYKS